MCFVLLVIGELVEELADVADAEQRGHVQVRQNLAQNLRRQPGEKMSRKHSEASEIYDFCAGRKNLPVPFKGALLCMILHDSQSKYPQLCYPGALCSLGVGRLIQISTVLIPLLPLESMLTSVIGKRH